MTDKRNRSPDHKGIASLHARASETAGTHVVIKHKAGEPADRARPRGWRLTRAMFAEFADDEQ
jgi:hypothetical protein